MNTSMKTVYVAPATEAVEVKMESVLCGSGDGKSSRWDMNRDGYSDVEEI